MFYIIGYYKVATKIRAHKIYVLRFTAHTIWELKKKIFF